METEQAADATANRGTRARRGSQGQHDSCHHTSSFFLSNATPPFTDPRSSDPEAHSRGSLSTDVSLGWLDSLRSSRPSGGEGSEPPARRRGIAAKLLARA